jgi:hypothetical protein
LLGCWARHSPVCWLASPQFVDGFKSLVVPAHLRPPEQSINWVPNLGDQELDRRMRQQVQTALGMISEVLTSLNQAIKKKGLERQVTSAPSPAAWSSAAGAPRLRLPAA